MTYEIELTADQDLAVAAATARYNGEHKESLTPAQYLAARVADIVDDWHRATSVEDLKAIEVAFLSANAATRASIKAALGVHRAEIEPLEDGGAVKSPK